MSVDESTFYDLPPTEFFGGIIGPEVAQVAESVNFIKRRADGVTWGGSAAWPGHDHGVNLGPAIPLVSGTVIGSVISPYLSGAGTLAANQRVAIAPITQASFSGSQTDNALVNRSTASISTTASSTAWRVNTGGSFSVTTWNDERTYCTVEDRYHKYLIAPFTNTDSGTDVYLYNEMTTPIGSGKDFYHYCNMSVLTNSLGDGSGSGDAHFFRCFSVDVPAYGEAKRVLVRFQMCATVDAINTDLDKVETVTNSDMDLWEVWLSETNAGGYDEGKKFSVQASSSKHASNFKWYELEWEIPASHASRAVLHFVIEAVPVFTHPDLTDENRSESNAILWFMDPLNEIPHPVVWAGIEW